MNARALISQSAMVYQPISNGNRTEWSTIQGVIGRVISNCEQDYS